MAKNHQLRTRRLDPPVNELLQSVSTSSITSIFVGLEVHKKTTVMAAYCAGEFIFEKTFQSRLGREGQG